MKVIVDEAKAMIPTDKDKAVNRLSHYVSEDDVEEAYDKLLAQADINGQVMADDVIDMWEPLEYHFTVSQLLEML